MIGRFVASDLYKIRKTKVTTVHTIVLFFMALISASTVEIFRLLMPSTQDIMDYNAVRTQEAGGHIFMWLLTTFIVIRLVSEDMDCGFYKNRLHININRINDINSKFIVAGIVALGMYLLNKLVYMICNFTIYNGKNIIKYDVDYLKQAAIGFLITYAFVCFILFITYLFRNGKAAAILSSLLVFSVVGGLLGLLDTFLSAKLHMNLKIEYIELGNLYGENAQPQKSIDFYWLILIPVIYIVISYFGSIIATKKRDL